MPSPEGYRTWTARWRGGLASEVSGRGHVVLADEPPEAGGEDTGPMPTELLAAGLASCFLAAVAWAARKRRIEVEDLEVDVTPFRAPGEPRHGRYEVVVRSSTPRAELEPAFELATRYCWVSNTLRTPPEIDYRLEAPGDAAASP
jgi:uncharacterized OsmC-like protein